MLSMATTRSCAVLALTALVERAVSVPQGAQATITPAAIPLGSAQALPDLQGSASAVSGACGGCYLVADVAALVWYSEVFLNTAATAVVSVATGNGTRATRTSIIQNHADYTFDPNRMSSAFSPELSLTAVTYDSTVTVGGAVLTSPTAYNVYSAYAITSEHYVNGQCVTTSGSTTTIASAYSETLTSANGRVTLDPKGESDFINFLGFTTCSGGGVTQVQSALVPVADITTTTSVTGSSVSLAAMTRLAPTTNPTITAAPGSLVTLTEIMSSTTVTAVLTGTAFPSASGTAPVVVIGGATVTATSGPFDLPAVDASVFSALLTPNATVVAPSGTVYGTGVGNYSVVPFLPGNSAMKMGSGFFTAIWGTALAAVVVVAGLL